MKMAWSKEERRLLLKYLREKPLVGSSSEIPGTTHIAGWR